MLIFLEGKSEKKDKNFEYAKQKLNDFKNGKIMVSEAFDIEKLSKFFAFSDVFEFHHGAVAKSVRYYFNPITLKFEPIGFDGHHGTQSGVYISGEMGINPKSGWYFDLYDEWFKLLFSNPKTFDYDFYKSYIENLKIMLDTSFSNKLIFNVAPKCQSDLELIKLDFEKPLKDRIFSFGPDEFVFSLDYVSQRQEHIKKLLSEKDRIDVFVTNVNGDSVTILIRNKEPIAIELSEISYLEKKINLKNQILIPIENYENNKTFCEIKVYLPEYKKNNPLQIKYNILGSKESSIKSIPFKNANFTINNSSMFHKNESNRRTRIQELRKQEFIIINEIENTIFIKKGKWKIESPLVLPNNYSLIIENGTDLDLVNHSYIQSNSCFLKGSKDEKIKIYSSDSTGRGLFVYSSKEKNVLENVEFSNLSAKPNLTGAITFYESSVYLKNCLFSNIMSEDALNIVRSEFELDSCTFDKTFSDAFDGDFTKGKVKNCIFENCGNDCVDFSGSEVSVQNSTFNLIGDKAISSGEKSKVYVESCLITKANIGLAAKDLSELNVNNCSISSCKYGIGSYQKKNVFGPGKIECNNVTFDDVKNLSIIDSKSSVIINNNHIHNKEKFVKYMLYDLD
jgi:hypothetical protein